MASAAAQTADVLSPEIVGNPDDPPRFLKRSDYGNPPGSGAGSTGFVSTNRPPKGQNTSQGTWGAPSRPLAPASAGRVASVSAQPRQLPQPISYPQPLPSADPAVTGTIAPKRKPAPEIDPYEPLGVRAGSLLLFPAIELSGGFDSNPHRATNPDASSLFIAAPELKVRSDWARHEFRADLRGNYTGYGSASSLNNPNFRSTLDGRIDWSRQTRIELQNRFLLSTDTPGSPNFQADVEKPTIYTTFGGSAGLVHRFNRLELAGKFNADRTSYRDSKLTDGTTASNEDRNFDEYGFELRGSYELTPGVRPFVAVEADRRVHDLAIDSSGIQRDSNGFSPRIGTSFELTRQLTGDVSVGYLKRNYKDPSLPELRGAIADASLAWSATRLTTVTLTANSAAYESIDADVSGILARDFGIQLDHAFRDWLIGTLELGFGLDDYVGSNREDRRFSAAAELTYKLNREMQIKGEARREQRSSNESGQDYTANIFLLGLRLQR
ncbi:MAG: outer membrane beta-barrel protein [Xanthobacteraceae bacterium]